MKRSRRTTDKIKWEEGEAPMDQQGPEPVAPTGIQVTTTSNIAAVNVCVTLFWWVWENWCGFTGYLSRQNAFGDMGLQFTAYMMSVTDIFEAFFSFIMRIVRLLWELVLWIYRTYFRLVYAFGIPLPIIFWYLIGLVLLYLLNAYWQLVLALIIDVIVPILNLLIVILNFLTLLITLLLRIVFQIWNIFVPFIGMIIYVLIDLVVTILQIVFDILQSDGLMNILQSVFEIIFFLVDIAMQILMVFLQLGMPILQVLAELLSFILEIIFVVIEVVLEILVWILDLLFKILEPILLIVQALCAAFSWMVSLGGMGRSLLSIPVGQQNRFTEAAARDGTLSGQPMHKFASQGDHTDYMDFVSSTYAQYARHVVYNSTSPSLTAGDESLDPDGWFAQSMRARKEGTQETPIDRIKRDIALRAASKRAGELPENFGSGRRLLETRRLVERSAVGKGLDDDEDEPIEGTKMDKTSEVFMSQFHYGVRKMVAEPTTNVELMHHTLGRVRDHQRKGRDDLAIQSIMQRVAHEHPELAGAPPGPAWVRYQDGVENPQEMHVRLQNERYQYADSRGIPRTHQAYLQKVAAEKKIVNPASSSAANRKLMGARTWLDDGQHMAASHLRNMELQHADQIRAQHEEYMDHHYNRILATKTIFHGTRERMLYHAQNTLHFDNFAKHSQNILERHGYKSIKEAYHDFLATHASAENFVLSLAYISELPGISFLKQYDERRDTHPFFHDWHAAMREREQLQQAGTPTPESEFTARKLLRTQPTQEDAEFAANSQYPEPAGRGTSKEKFEGLEIISKTDCFSVPRNPLCMPEIPADLGEKLQIGKITIDERLKDDSDLCDPWMPDSNPIGLVRITNGFHSIRFLISGFPPLNYLLTTFSLLVPWLAWTVDWVFLVPKGHLASFAQIFCFFISIYDLILFVLFIRAVWWALRFLSETLGRFIGDLITARQRGFEFKEKIVQQRTNDRLLEQQFRAYNLLEKEREVLDRTETEESARTERDRLANDLGVPVHQPFIQAHLGGRFDHRHPYAKNHMKHIHYVTQSVDSRARYLELFRYYLNMLQLSVELDESGQRPVNQNAVRASWRRLCKKYPDCFGNSLEPLKGVIIEGGDDTECTAAASSSSSVEEQLPQLNPFFHPEHSSKHE